MSQAAAPPRGGHAAQETLIMAGRALRSSLSAKAQPIPQLVIFPLFFFYTFYVVFHRLLDGRGVDYAQFLPPAIVVQSVMWIAVQAALATVSDRRSGLLARFRSMPVSPAALPLGRLIADGLRALVPTVVIVLAGLTVGFRFRGGFLAAVGFFAVAAVFSVSLIAGCLALGAGARNPGAVSTVLTAPYMALLTISSAFAPAGAFPGWLQPVVRFSPVTAAIDTMRALASGGPLATPGWRFVAWSAGLLIVFGWAATRAFRRSR